MAKLPAQYSRVARNPGETSSYFAQNLNHSRTASNASCGTRKEVRGNEDGEDNEDGENDEDL